MQRLTNVKPMAKTKRLTEYKTKTLTESATMSNLSNMYYILQMYTVHVKQMSSNVK